jgi:hypothetical protein
VFQFLCSDELVASQSTTFDFLRPLLQKPDDRPDGLVFVYSLALRASQATMAQWSQGLAQLFHELTGAGPRYMFIGDLSAPNEDAAADELQEYVATVTRTTLFRACRAAISGVVREKD